MKETPIQIICGPTASGKSALALDIARREGGVVINADSMQVYAALPLLTAQPSAAEMADVPHRLYGALPPHETCSAQRWREMAIREIHRAWNEKQQPVLVGGTGLYIRALTEGFSPVPEIGPEFRERVIARHRELGNPAFHAELAGIDPVMAAKLNPNDSQRLMRAMEVITATGRSLAYWQELPLSGPPEGMSFEITPVLPERAELYRRCDERFGKMMAAGALGEVRDLDAEIAAGRVPEDASITHALGFKSLRRHLRGEIGPEDAATLAKAETRQYAKRQVTWFTGQL